MCMKVVQVIAINSVTLDRTVRAKIAERIPQINEKFGARMSRFDSAFICGLIEAYRPRKIVEVGVSFGGTTAVILQCLSDLGYEFEMHSIDCEVRVVQDRSQLIGCLGEEARQLLGITSHKLHAGTILPQCIEEIGPDIDLLILDTMHSLPGETLDFLAAFPYLSENAVVCLHDVRENFKSWEKRALSATAALFSCVAAEKYINEDERRSHSYPNIAAFQITPDTGKYISNVVELLMVSWDYMPADEQLKAYLDVIEAHFGDEVNWILDRAVALNRDLWAQRPDATEEAPRGRLRRMLAR